MVAIFDTYEILILHATPIQSQSQFNLTYGSGENVLTTADEQQATA